MGTKRSLLMTDGRGLPLVGANVIDFKMLEHTLDAIATPRPAPTAAAPQNLCLDKGYDYDAPRQIAYDYGFTTHIRRRGEDCAATPASPAAGWSNAHIPGSTATAASSCDGKSSP
jgi:hypothetical protein